MSNSGLVVFPSSAEIAAANPAQVTDQAVAETDGIVFVPTRNLSCLGADFYWPGGHGALSVKVSLWDWGANTLIVDAPDTAVDAQGIYAGLFTTPVALQAGKAYAISKYETSGARGIYMTNAQISTVSSGIIALNTALYGIHVEPGWYCATGCFLAGDGFPASTDSNDSFCLTPLLR